MEVAVAAHGEHSVGEGKRAQLDGPAELQAPRLAAVGTQRAERAIGAAAMFVWELTRHTPKPDNIPFEPEVRSLRVGTGVGVRVKF